MNRRNFVSTAAATATFALARPFFGKKAGSAALTHKERVDRALRGQDLDRPPFTFYKHYKRPTAQLEAQDHLEFHRTYDTDIVKVMNDFDYPKATTGKWYELKPLDSPFPTQLATLRLVRDGLNGDAYFIDTIYGPYMTAMILFQSQPQFANLGKSEEVEDEQIKSLHEFQQQSSDAWHSALEVITQSIINHIRHIKDIGASGALVSIFNAKVSSALLRITNDTPGPMTSGSSMRLPTQSYLFCTCIIWRGHTLISSRTSMRLSSNTP